MSAALTSARRGAALPPGRAPRSGTLGAVVAAVALLAAAPHAAAEQPPEVTQAEADQAARAVAHYCKVVSDRIAGIISDQWATQDLQDLASVWRDLNCHQVFGVDERVRLRVR